MHRSRSVPGYVTNEFVSKVLELKPKANFNPYVKKRPNLAAMSVKERQDFIKKNPEYGQIICNCEKVSLGEILFEMNTSVPPKTIKAIKKRTRAGFGKCQGGFCQPLVTKIISQELNIPLDKVLFQRNDSFVVRYKVKDEK